MKIVIALIIGSIPFLASSASPGTISLSATGQQTCYSSSGSVLSSCSGTGQDGDWKSGVSVTSARFTVGVGTQSECVTDNLTGLVWMKTPPGSQKTWQGALDYVKNSMNGPGGFCGYSDWRVPNIIEMESLFNAEQADPAAWLNAQGFVSVLEASYWSSTTRSSDSAATNVALYNGLINFTNKAFATGYYAWPVRGGQVSAPAQPWRSGQMTCFSAGGSSVLCPGTGQDGDLRPGVPWPTPRFSDNGNGTITDNLTGLVWLKNANCYGTVSWSQALASANALASGNCSLVDSSVSGDWRLPNRRELLSLIDYEYTVSALSDTAGTGKWSQGDPFNNVQTDPGYWSSTTNANHPAFAWYVTAWDGSVQMDAKTANYSFWAVRDCMESLVRIGQTPYSNLQEAYNNAVTNDVIQARVASFTSLSLNNPNAAYLTINGGFNCGFSGQPGLSSVGGPIIISAGTVVLSGIAIK